MQIVKATASYEQWLRNKIRIIDGDLERKHRAMAEDLFSFLRATFYRWIQVWPEVCSAYTSAPQVLAVGDLHVDPEVTGRSRVVRRSRGRGSRRTHCRELALGQAATDRGRLSRPGLV